MASLEKKSGLAQYLSVPEKIILVISCTHLSDQVLFLFSCVFVEYTKKGLLYQKRGDGK